MKKLALLCAIIMLIAVQIVAEPQEVQSVVNITPDMLPEEPAHTPIKTAHEQPEAVDFATTGTVQTRLEHPSMSAGLYNDIATKKKLSAAQTLDEYFDYLMNKINKLRNKSHIANAKIHALDRRLSRAEQNIQEMSNTKNGESHV